MFVALSFALGALVASVVAQTNLPRNTNNWCVCLAAESQSSPSSLLSPFNCNTLTCNPCSKVSKVDFVFIVDVTTHDTTRALENTKKKKAKRIFSVACFRF
jgi:hypothetical protein